MGRCASVRPDCDCTCTCDCTMPARKPVAAVMNMVRSSVGSQERFRRQVLTLRVVGSELVASANVRLSW